MRRLRRRFDRMIIRVLSRRRTPVEAIRDVDYVREVIRFTAMFSSMILLPFALLSMLALRSLETEEISIDAGLATRADAIATGVQSALDRTFAGFEADVRRRLDSGDASLDTLCELVPSLRGIYRFDADGRLIAPFRLRTQDDDYPGPSPRFARGVREAQSLQREGHHEDSVAAWSVAIEVADNPAHVAEASFGRARALERSGKLEEAREAYILVAAEHQQARDRNGFRIADLCSLRRATVLDALGMPEEARALRKLLVGRALAAPWTVGIPGEAFVAREALDRLSPRPEPDWHRSAQQALGDRARLLQWASTVEDELTLLGSRIQANVNFAYYPEERALWATVTRSNVTWAFSFDYDGLKRRLGTTVLEVANGVDPDLSASLASAGQDLGEALERRSLAPRLPLVEVLVRPLDPAALAAQRRNTRRQQRMVLFLTMISTLAGVIGAARMAIHQLDLARAKADFAANVSHELRSPLTQIRLKGESLQLDLVDDDEDRRGHYDDIVREAERLSRLVDNVLDFAAIERGQKSYLFRPEDLGEILWKAIEGQRPAASAAGLEITLDLPHDLPVLWVDREAISQVAVNLLSNATKYGASGDRIDVFAEIWEDEVAFSVQDHGIGISRLDQRHIFEQFYRVQSTDVRRKRGTGIGLTIVRYIVEAHGGSIGVTSEPGKGSTFTVTLPVEPPPEAGG
jgi:signal transduction histidine kinase